MQEELSIRPADPLARDENLLELPFESESIARINCSGVLMHVVDLEGALEELARVLKKGGRMVIEEANADSVHASGWEPIVRGVKRVIGAPISARVRTERGIEEWVEDGTGGGLLIRKLDARFLVRFLAEHDLVLVERSATELIDDDLGSPTLKRIIAHANRWYLELEGPPALASGNQFVFEKRIVQA